MRPRIAQNLRSISDRIAAAATRSGREMTEVKLIAVSKTHPAEVLRETMGAGVSAFGENKVQEAEGKILEIGRGRVE